MRIEQIRPLLLERMRKEWNASENAVVYKILDLLNSSRDADSESLDKFVVGCVCKETPIRASFLKDYTKYVIPSTLEVEAQEEGDISEIMPSFSDDKGNSEEMEAKLAEILKRNSAPGIEKEESQSTSDAYAYLTSLYKKEKIWFEDESGRVEVEVKGDSFSDKSGLNPLEIVTGMVIAAEGKLDIHSGKFIVRRWMLAGVDDVLNHRPANSKSEVTSVPKKGRYIAFISTINCCEATETDGVEIKKVKTLDKESAKEASPLTTLRTMLKNQNASTSATKGTVESPLNAEDIASNLEHVILCGGLIPDLDSSESLSGASRPPLEVAQRRSQIRLDSEETASRRDTMAINMRKADEFIHDLIEESELMENSSIGKKKHLTIIPSHNDPSNHFYPQQPLYPFCLPMTASLQRENKDCSWKVDLVTNPCHLSIRDTDSDKETLSILGTSGENIQDCMRYTHNLIPEIDWLERCLLARHLCPTAPDTLPCYPYTVKGSKKFADKLDTTDHGISADPFCLIKNTEDSMGVPDVLFAGGCSTFATRYLPHIGRRLIAIPSFAKTHSFCVMNIDSPTLDTYEIRLREPRSEQKEEYH